MHILYVLSHFMLIWKTGWHPLGPSSLTTECLVPGTAACPETSAPEDCSPPCIWASAHQRPSAFPSYGRSFSWSSDARSSESCEIEEELTAHFILNPLHRTLTDGRFSVIDRKGAPGSLTWVLNIVPKSEVPTREPWGCPGAIWFHGTSFFFFFFLRAVSTFKIKIKWFVWRLL